MSILNIIFSDKFSSEKNSLYVVGGTEREYKDNILRLDIPSDYDHYTERVIEALRFVVKDKEFDKYNFFFISEGKKNHSLIRYTDYYGEFYSIEGDRLWHRKKGSSQEIFKGEYVPWCSISKGFILSRYSVNLIIQEQTYEIYPDLFIAKILRRNGICAEKQNTILNMKIGQQNCIQYVKNCSMKTIYCKLNKHKEDLEFLIKLSQSYPEIQFKAVNSLLMKKVNKINNIFMVICSCKKYAGRRKIQELTNCPFEYRYFIGDPDIKNSIDDGNIVTLPCRDNYEDLHMKCKLAMKWVLENKPGISHIFKTDDDIVFNFPKLYSASQKVLENNIRYCGRVIKMTDKMLTKDHFGKCSDENFNKSLCLKAVKYCSGGGYFLSKHCMKLFVNYDAESFIEDYEVGNCLNSHKIYPTHISIYKNICYW